MNVFKYLLVAGVILSSLALFAGCNKSSNATDDSIMQDSEMAQDDEIAQYIPFADSKYQELDGKKPYALFFHANWCPTCRSIDKRINEAISSFPEGTKILKVDFDTELELRKKFTVTVQSIIIIVDKDGNVASKLTDPSIDELKMEIQETLA